ncbi:hypothetical protein AB0E56_11185 [Microbacterium sp. NPDC028030]|uniref:hypothetical protein n=1 Tax=Microbacterium sp. NPDC028030 TaxID=3155124 RepID=UPI0033E3B990
MTTAIDDLPAAQHAAQTARIALAATQRELWRERTLRRLPHLEPVIGLVSGDSEKAYASRADELDAALTAARSARGR